MHAQDPEARGIEEGEGFQGLGVAECTSIVVTREGIKVCKDTGEVLNDAVIDYGAEWRVFSDQQKVKGMIRAGSPLTSSRHDQGLSVSVQAHGNPNIHNRGSRNFRRRTRQYYATSPYHVSPKDRYKVDIMTRLNNASDSLQLSNTVKETAGMILHHYMSREKPLKNEYNALVAAALHKAVEIHNEAVNSRELYEILDVTEREVWRAKKKLNDAGSFAVIEVKRDSSRLRKRVETYIELTIDQLGLPKSMYSLCIEFLDVALAPRWKSLYGKKPEVVAAVVVYFVARLLGYQVSQKRVAEIAKVKESNIRKLYRYLIDGTATLVAV